MPGRIISKRVAQQIVDTVKDVCDHDINFINKDGYIFASTDTTRIGDFHEIGRTVSKTGSTIEVSETETSSYHGTQKGVNIPISYHGEVVATIGISGEPDEVRQYAYLAQKIATFLLKEQELEEQSSQRSIQLSYLIRALITGESANYEYLNNLIDHFRLNPNFSYTTCIIKLSSRYNPSNLVLIENSIQSTLENMHATCYAFFYPNEYVAIVKTDQLKKHQKTLQKLADKYKGIMSISVGSSEPLFKQHISYKACEIARQSLRKPENFVIFDHLDLEILIGSTTDNARKQFLDKALYKLNEKDISLLKSYFENEMSLKKTSDALIIHKNTLQYQLNRIYEKCGYNPRNFHDSVVLYLGIRLSNL